MLCVFICSRRVDAVCEAATKRVEFDWHGNRTRHEREVVRGYIICVSWFYVVIERLVVVWWMDK